MCWQIFIPGINTNGTVDFRTWLERNLSGKPGKVQFLKHLTPVEKPSFVFLSETISSYKKMEVLCKKLEFDSFLAVEPQGKNGGIAMFWKTGDKVDLQSFSRLHIDVIVSSNVKPDWRLTGIYGEPARANRHKTWDLIRNLARGANLPWCLVGDFNNVISQADKKGGSQYPNYLIDGFNSCLQDSHLHDLELVGHQYIWEKRWNTEH
ncbi:uncharacterized protein LOC141691806 [Apium graveolens]|uniref:uncharacterized protein LOC141691806 n=1 Tax=Apium graveolens TaxID=4045 RepID=UPI003D79850F